MRWIKGKHPRKTGFKGVVNAPVYLLRFRDNTKTIKLWLGDRFCNLNNGGNVVTHYMKIEDVPK
jgi:hypothetical protein